MFSKKAKKIDEIFTVNLTLCRKRQIDMKIFSNSVAFLENMNFNSQYFWKWTNANPMKGNLISC